MVTVFLTHIIRGRNQLPEFIGCETQEKIRRIRHVTDLLFDRQSMAIEVLTVHFNRPSGWCDDTDQALDGCGLTGTVMANQADNLPIFDGQIQVVKGNVPIVIFGNSVKCNHVNSLIDPHWDRFFLFC